MQNPIQLPVVDLSPLLDYVPSATKSASRIAFELQNACMSHGAFYVTCSSFSRDSELKILDSTRRFFNLPESVKSNISIKSGGFTRGYIAMGVESGSHRVESKEALSYGYEWNPSDKPSNSLQGPNEWDNLDEILGPEWRKSLNEFYSQMVFLAKLLVKGLEIALHLELQSYCTGGETISLMRLFHYFPYSNEQNEVEAIGSSPHTDWGFLTLLLQPDNVKGLQIFYDNEWRDIASKPGHIVVNCGDYLSLITKGSFISPLHRVISDGANERYSMVFFYYPKYDAHIPVIDVRDPKIHNLSIFKDQKYDKDDKRNEQKQEMSSNIDGVCFGEYIARKWDQVYRG
ncbi:13589_t:CDS:2 [Ambispora gerdemannii]|uniref:13589_t:CDS:1 n=1 Tax=Ambispora gerdemannii TaxID=144530 RepID=A0A9N8V851_9GLOM|nr:13589_t:CDS:2 [Ambispora gerdemannii]